MNDVKARRGRPKGSGIDDTSRIERMIALITSDPQLKPTTAIRCLGISDPSAIRRIRDKYTKCMRAARESGVATMPSRRRESSTAMLWTAGFAVS